MVKELGDFKSRAEIRRTGGSYFVYIPPAIIDMIELKEGDIVEIPFLLFNKIERKPNETEEVDEPYEYEPNGVAELEIKRKDRYVTLTRQDIIDSLNNAVPEMENWRTMYTPWHNKKYNMGALMSALLGEYVNSGQAAIWFERFGFKIVKVVNK